MLTLPVQPDSGNSDNPVKRRNTFACDNDRARYLAAGVPPLHPLGDVQSGDGVLLACRVSGRGQRTHLIGQAADIWSHLEPIGARLFGVHAAVCSGYAPDWICRAVALARQRGARWLVVESPNRAVRHPCYGQAGQGWQARAGEWNELAELTGGFPIASVVPPDAGAAAERAHETAREERHSNQPAELGAVVRALYRGGFSYRAIEAELGILTSPFRLPGLERKRGGAPPISYSTARRMVRAG